MNTRPMKLYLQARDAVATDPAGAAAKIREALGNANLETPVLDRAIAKALDTDTMLGDGLLELVMHEATK